MVMLLFTTTPPLHSHRSLNRGFPALQCRHSGSASCKPWAVARAAEGEPGSRDGEGAGPAGSSSSDEDAVAAVLASVGLDPAELQRQASAAYSQLNPVLAQVLGEVQADWGDSSGGTRVPDAAELMARICFLAREVGLTAIEIWDMHRRERRCLSFSLGDARSLHDWLRLQGLSTDQLRLASRGYNGLWAANVLKLENSKEHVQQQLSVTNSQWCKAFTTNPWSLVASPERVDGVIAWLEAKPLGFSRAEMAKLWLSLPGLFALSADVLQHRLRQLVSRFLLDEDDLRRVVCSSPALLTLDSDSLLSKLDSLLVAEPGVRASIPSLLCSGGSALGHSTETLLSKVKFLREYGFDEEQLCKVLSHHMVLTSSLEDKIKPTLAALQSVLGSRRDVVATVSKQPSLVVSAVETIEGNVAVMQKLGLSPADIRKSVGKQPQLFAYDFQREDFRAKLRYFQAVLGRSPQHMLLEQPSHLKMALWRVDYRVSFMEHKGDQVTLPWVGMSDRRFCEQYGYSVAEFEAWREQWVRSERARQYGLDKAKEPGIARALQARQKRLRAKVAAARKRVLAAGQE